jgi:hypothetical protein
LLWGSSGVCAAEDDLAASSASPDGRLTVEFQLDDGGRPQYAVLFTSGIQHYAETPEGTAQAPA